MRKICLDYDTLSKGVGIQNETDRLQVTGGIWSKPLNWSPVEGIRMSDGILGQVGV
jgi:hypothetical protein